MAEHAQTYMFAYMPGLVMYGFVDIQRKFLNMVGRSNVPLIAVACGEVVHLYLCKVLVWDNHMNVTGIGIASSAANLVNFLIMLVYTCFISEVKDANFFPRYEPIWELKEQFNLGLASSVMMCLEWWAYEIMLIMTGPLGVVAQAAIVLLVSLNFFVWHIFLGFQSAASFLIGKEIGSNRAVAARNYYHTISGFCMCLWVVVSVVVYVYYEEMAMVFTTNQDVIAATRPVVPVVAIGMFSDLHQMVLQGVVKALGIQ